MKYAPPLDASGPNESYVDANPSAGIQGSIVPAAALEPGMREIVKVIEDAGLAPSDGDNTQLAQAINLLIATALGTVSNDLIYPGAFHDFYEQAPLTGWMVRDGSLIANASTAVPKLYATLQLAANAGKLKTEAEWQALSSTAGGIGGVPFFVLNISTNTIRLPDTRGDYARCAGSAFLPNVGDWHKDAIRDFTGGFVSNASLAYPDGVFETDASQYLPRINSAVNGTSPGIKFDPSLVVPTADENRTRAFALLGCVYVGV